jgi:hypothetical protein
LFCVFDFADFVLTKVLTSCLKIVNELHLRDKLNKSLLIVSLFVLWNRGTVFETLSHSLTQSLTHSLIHSLIHSFTLTLSFTHSLIHSLIHSLTHSFTHSLTHSFIHSFIHLFILIFFSLTDNCSQICLIFVCCTFQSFSISYRIFLLFCAIGESLCLLNEVYENKKICVGPHVDLGTITWILAFLMSKHLFHFLYLQTFILCCHIGVEFELQTIWNRNFSDWVLILILSRSSNLNWRNNFCEKKILSQIPRVLGLLNCNQHFWK